MNMQFYNKKETDKQPQTQEQLRLNFLESAVRGVALPCARNK